MNFVDYEGGTKDRPRSGLKEKQREKTVTQTTFFWHGHQLERDATRLFALMYTARDRDAASHGVESRDDRPFVFTILYFSSSYRNALTLLYYHISYNMGITGLLPLLKDIQVTRQLSEYAGQTIAVDAYVWLHRGTYGCAAEISTGRKTTRYVNLFSCICLSLPTFEPPSMTAYTLISVLCSFL